MKLAKFAACAVIVLSLQAEAPYAQTLSSIQAPAEFPPASYQGRQYVDSQGCVFIRAGVGGLTTWVPRVTRGRQIICGQKPTFDPSQRVTTAAVRPTPSKVEQITLDAPAAEPVAPVAATPKPKAEPKRVARVQPQPEPKPQRVVRAAPKPEPKPQRVVRAAPKPKAAPAANTATRVSATRAAPIRNPVRPGAGAARPETVAAASRTQPVPQVRRVTVARPQTVTRAPVATPAPTQVRSATAVPPTRVLRGTAASRTDVAERGDVRVLPRHLYENRLSVSGVRVPQGYKRVWEDDRLNIRRAEQSMNGYERAKLVWTNTVPRRLVDRQSGRDVTAKLPLVYPYTDEATQEREFGKVSLVRKDGKLMKRIVRNVARAKPAAPKTARVSTRSAPKATRVERAKVPAPKTVATGNRYVQVGVFGVPSNAQRTAQRLKAAGLPVRIGSVTRKGKPLQLVVAGPFPSDAQASRALSTVRAQGFSDAYLRR